MLCAHGGMLLEHHLACTCSGFMLMTLMVGDTGLARALCGAHGQEYHDEALHSLVLRADWQ